MARVIGFPVRSSESMLTERQDTLCSSADGPVTLAGTSDASD